MSKNLKNSLNKVLVTGAAGFIGFHASKKLKERGDTVLGLDNFNSYYDPSLKERRSAELKECGVEVRRVDLTDKKSLHLLFSELQPTHVLHLAAQAGVRYSMTNPDAYVDSNLIGFINLLELIKERPKTVFVYASSSSVYGNRSEVPFKEDDRTDTPVSLYGATKKANELIAHSYHHLYQIPVTGLRFFTVYGPSGRPDMAPWIFTKAIFEEKPLPLFAGGELYRDFTYIDDIVDGTVAALDAGYPSEIFNLGHHQPVQVKEFVKILEKKIGKRALIEPLPMQPGDVKITSADLEKSKRMLGFEPKVSLEEGLGRFVNWWVNSRL